MNGENLKIDDLCKQYGIKKEEFKNEPPKCEDITSPFDNEYRKFGVRIDGIGGLI